MTVLANNNEAVIIRYFQLADTPQLSVYLNSLSAATRQRFAPHGFDEASIIRLYEHPSAHIGFVACTQAHELIGYAVLQIGHQPHETERFTSYGVQTDALTDCSFAPSVADKWQSSGIGSAMMPFIINEMKKFGMKRMFLWGGVQATNEKAIRFYRKYQFQQIGIFEYNGANLDMMRMLM